jgi:hypothetical protein
MVDSCEYGDEPQGSGAMELIISFYAHFAASCSFRSHRSKTNMWREPNFELFGDIDVFYGGNSES